MSDKEIPTQLGTPEQEGVDPTALSEVLKEANGKVVKKRKGPISVEAPKVSDAEAELQKLAHDLRSKYELVMQSLDSVQRHPLLNNSKIAGHATTAAVRTVYPGQLKGSVQNGGNTELIEVRTFITEPTRVNINLGMTLNIGNMEFARIDVGMSTPCYEEEKEQCFLTSREWITNRMRKEVRKVRGLPDPDEIPEATAESATTESKSIETIVPSTLVSSATAPVASAVSEGFDVTPKEEILF